MAKALEALYEDQTDDVAVQLAWHYAEAGLDRKAAVYYRRAGELASARYANDEAIAHLSRSLELTPEKDASARLELLLARETVYQRQGKRTEQGQDLAALARLAAALKDGRAQAQVSLRQAESGPPDRRVRGGVDPRADRRRAGRAGGRQAHRSRGLCDAGASPPAPGQFRGGG